MNQFPIWALIIGTLLITMALSGSLRSRLPVSTAMLYLLAGYGLGPAGLGLIAADPLLHSVILERITEIAVLISLFASGLKLGIPLSDNRWHLPLRLATLSMTLTVMLITAVGIFGLGLSLGAAILLGSILAPTDPVLASDVQVENADDFDRLRFGLTGEGGLNDGTAFPFVMLGLGVLGLHDLGSGGWRWLTVDLLWAILAGVIIGGALGTAIGRLVVYLRVHHQEAIGLDEFLAMGLIALAYGVAVLSHAYGFLAVFAAGVALQRATALPDGGKGATQFSRMQNKQAHEMLASNPTHASAYMMQAVRGFNEQLERIAALAVVVVVGAMLPFTYLSTNAIWLILLLFLVIRPASVLIGLLGVPMSSDQRILISWFGIRGIGSIYYLMYALSHRLPHPLAEEIIAITLCTVTVSIVLHGLSVTPLMLFYAKRKAERRSEQQPT